MTVLCFQAAEGLVEALGEAKELYIGILDTECQALHEIRHAAQAQLDAQVPHIEFEVAPIIDACSNLEVAESALRANNPARALSATKRASAYIREALRFFWGSSFNDGTTQTALDPPRGGGRFAPIKSSNYGGRPLTGPSPEDLSEARVAELVG